MKAIDKKKIIVAIGGAIVLLLLSGFSRPYPSGQDEHLAFVIPRQTEAPGSETGQEGGSGFLAINTTEELSARLKSVAAASCTAFEGIEIRQAEIYIDGELCLRLPIFGERICTTVKDFSYIAAQPSNGDSIDGVRIKSPPDGRYIEVGERCFYVDEPFINVGTKTYYPFDVLAEIYEVPYSVSEDGSRVDVERGDSVFLVRGASEVYSHSDLYWLSRLLYAEAGAESLEGMIAIGNVVMNRVASGAFPDNVIDVIFDEKHAVQFTPASTGAINNDPSELAIIAAKICFEGKNIVGDSLFFVNPEKGIDDWFKRARTFVVTIGRHDFYA